MSAPIHNIRDGVIPAVAPAQVTEAHELLFDKIAHGGISKAQALQLIADSEARAVQEMASRIQAAFHEPLIKERDQLRAEVERLKNLLLQADELNEGALFKISKTIKRAEKAEAEVERLNRVIIEFIACENGTDWKARAERAEAELAKERVRLETLRNLMKELFDKHWILGSFNEYAPGKSWIESAQAAIEEDKL